MTNPVRYPSLEALLAFEAVARLHSMELAADELAVTRSAVSKRISTLEALVGVALFERGPKAVRPTVAGKEYLTQVQSLLAQLAQVSLHQRAAQARSVLRVTAPPTFAAQVLVPVLGSFSAAERFDVEISVAEPYLEQGGQAADVRIGFGVRDLNALLFEPVFAVASPAYVRRYNLAKAAKALSRATLIRCPLEPWGPYLSAAGLPAAEPAQGPRLVDLGLCLQAASAGLGVSLARASLARAWLARGELVRLYPQLQVRTGTGYRLEVVNATPQALAFAQWLRQVCAALEEKSATAG